MSAFDPKRAAKRVAKYMSANGARSRAISSRLGNHFVDHAAAAVEGPIVCASELEVRRAFDVLGRRAIREACHRCPDRRRDHLIAAWDGCVESAAAIEVRTGANVNG